MTLNSHFTQINTSFLVTLLFPFPWTGLSNGVPKMLWFSNLRLTISHQIFTINYSEVLPDAVSRVPKDLLCQNQCSFNQKQVSYFSSAIGYFPLAIVFHWPPHFFLLFQFSHIFKFLTIFLDFFLPHNKIPQDLVLLLFLLATQVEVITWTAPRCLCNKIIKHPRSS